LSSSPTKGSSKLEILAGVKSQVASSMSGWLSGGISGLNRGGAAPAEGDPGLHHPDPSDGASRDLTSTEHVKDDDASRWVAGYVTAASRTPRLSSTGRQLLSLSLSLSLSIPPSVPRALALSIPLTITFILERSLERSLERPLERPLALLLGLFSTPSLTLLLNSFHQLFPSFNY
jgi:hypothetical protein